VNTELRTQNAELQDVPVAKRDKALKRLGLIKEFTGFCKIPGKVRSEALTAFCTQKEIKRATFYRWLAKYKTQGIAGLVDMRGGGKFISQTISNEAFELFKSMYLTEQQMSVKICWQNISFINKNEAHNWKVPPLQYMYRIVKRRIPMPVQVLHREGFAAYEAKCAPYIQTDPDSIEPGQIWIGDHSEFNCKIFHRGKWIRPWITAWMDLRSRTIVGWHISFNPNQTTVLLAMKRAVEKYGPPDSVKIDNGKDYDSEMFTGTTKIKRRMIRAGYLDEQMLAGIYAMMDIVISFAIPYHPQGKGEIERFFDTLDMQFTKTFKTYCGKDPQRKPEDHNKLLKSEKLTTEYILEKFTSQFNRYIEAYNSTAHIGTGMEERSPLEVFATRQSQRVLPEGVAELLLRIWSRELIVGKNGVRFRGIYYGQYDMNLLMHQGKRVRVNYDPDDLRSIHIYDVATYNLVAIAEQNQLVQYGRAIDEQSLRDAMRQKSRAVKIARQFKDTRLTVNMELTDLTIAAMRDAAKSRQPAEAEHIQPRLRPVFTPLNSQVKEIQRLEIIKEVKKAAGGETIARVLNMDLSALRTEIKSKVKLFDE
jgi:putative transposase